VIKPYAPDDQILLLISDPLHNIRGTIGPVANNDEFSGKLRYGMKERGNAVLLIVRGNHETEPGIRRGVHAMRDFRGDFIFLAFDNNPVITRIGYVVLCVFLQMQICPEIRR
jgi:hypothetical protein